MGFIIWTLSGMFFIGEGIYCIKFKKEVSIGFWTNRRKKYKSLQQSLG